MSEVLLSKTLLTELAVIVYIFEDKYLRFTPEYAINPDNISFTHWTG